MVADAELDDDDDDDEQNVLLMMTWPLNVLPKIPNGAGLENCWPCMDGGALGMGGVLFWRWRGGVGHPLKWRVHELLFFSLLWNCQCNPATLFRWCDQWLSSFRRA